MPLMVLAIWLFVYSVLLHTNLVKSRIRPLILYLLWNIYQCVHWCHIIMPYEYTINRRWIQAQHFFFPNQYVVHSAWYHRCSLEERLCFCGTSIETDHKHMPFQINEVPSVWGSIMTIMVRYDISMCGTALCDYIVPFHPHFESCFPHRCHLWF